MKLYLIKKHTAILLSLAMVLSLAGCGSKAAGNTESNAELKIKTEFTTFDSTENSNANIANESETSETSETVSENVTSSVETTVGSVTSATDAPVIAGAVEMSASTGTPADSVISGAAAPSIAAAAPSTTTVVSSALNQAAAEIAAAEAAVQATTAAETTSTAATSAATQTTQAAQSATSAGNSVYVNLLAKYGYSYVENMQQVTSLFSQAMNGTYDEAGYCYVKLVAPEGTFDGVASSMESLHNATLAYGGESTGTNPILAEMQYVQNNLGFNYQEYITNGMNCILLVKLSDPSYGYTLYEIVGIPDSSSSEMAAARSKAKEIAATYNYGTTYEKIKNVHDYICRNVVYDTTLVKDDIHTAYGSLVKGIAVCDGYAEGFKMIMDELGISCNMIMNSTHEWNEVMLDGKWYFVDCTNDDGADGTIYYMNLLIGQDVFLSSVAKAVIFTQNGSRYYLIFSTERIYYYGYGRRANTNVNTLASTSYNQEIVTYSN